MLPTQLEFEITQWLDGDLPPEREAMLQRQLAADPQALRLVEEYRKLNEWLEQLPPPPEVDWDALQARIGQAVARQQTRRPVYAWRQLALAACILLSLGVGMRLFLFQSRSAGPVAMVRINGVESPSAGAVPVTQIAISPAPALDDQHQLALLSAPGEAPPRVIIGTGRQPAQDAMLVALAR